MYATIFYGWTDIAMSAATAVFCLIAAATLASLIRLNKGARLNRAWGLLALGLVCFGLAGIDRTFELLGLPNAADAREALSAGAALLVMIGAVYGRSLYRGLLK